MALLPCILHSAICARQKLCTDKLQGNGRIIVCRVRHTMLRSIRARSVSRPLTWLRLCSGSCAYLVTGTRAPTCDGRSATARAVRSGGLSVTLKALCEVVVGQLWDRMFAKKAEPAVVEMRVTVDNPIPHPQERVVTSARPVRGAGYSASGGGFQ